MSKKTVYEPHPVSPERKAELRAQGYKIIDAQFAPKDYLRVDGQDETAKPLTIPQIKEALAAKEIEIPEGVTKRDDLLALLEGTSEA